MTDADASRSPEAVMVPPERSFVFNIVWTGSVFTYLRYFVASQIAHSGARFRFVANACPPDQVRLMERFAERLPDRVIEVLEVSSTEMVTHGTALDVVRSRCDDGDHFCFIDADILATGPFVADFAEVLVEPCAGVTSGRGIWVDDDVLPVGHPGVAGEHFYSPTGFLFGSPHFAMYRRGPLDATCDRWGIGFAIAGDGLSDATRARLRDAGHDYFIFDTGKIVNILLQEDGNTLRHFEHPNLMHIGGVSHYLAPFGERESPDYEGEKGEPNWQTWTGMEVRFEVARYTARVLQDLVEGNTARPVPAGLDESVRERLVPVRSALIELMAKHRDDAGPD